MAPARRSRSRSGGTIRLTGRDGKVTIDDPHAETSVEVRNAEVDVTLRHPTPLTLITSERSLRLRLDGSPAITVDAVATDGGRIVSEDFRLQPESVDRQQKLAHTFGDRATARDAQKSSREHCDRKSEVIGFRLLRESACSPPLFSKRTLRSHARAPRQGPRRLRSRRASADRRDRSHFGVRLRARLRHSRQGQGADAAVGVLVRSRSATWCRIIWCRSTSTTFPAVDAAASRRAARPIDARAQDRAAAGRVRGARLSLRIGLEGLPADRRRLRHPAAGRPAGIRPAARADLHAGDQGRDRATTRTSAKPQAGDIVGRDLIARLRELTLEHLRTRRRSTPRRAASSSPTPSSSSGWPATAARAHRRGADAGLVALLAARPVPARPAASRASTSSSCATTWSSIGWNKQPPVPSLPDDVVQRTRGRSISRRTGG